MIFSKRKIIILIGLCSCVTLLAQETSYYKQERVVKNNVDIASPSGGQFISFYKDICYESDIKGVTVSNGQLEYNYKESSEYKIYEGNSYFGHCTFKFNRDLSRLNIICQDGTIYVYTRTTPPSGITTSSLIKKHGYISNTQAGAVNNSGNYQNDGSFSGINGISNSNTDASSGHWITVKKECPSCHSKGYDIIEKYIGTFGLDAYQKRCELCGGYYMSSYTHVHQKCRVCDGKGYVERREYVR